MRRVATGWRRWPRGGSQRLGFRRQIIVLAAAISVLAAFVLVLTVQLVLNGLATRTADEVLANRADALASSVRAASTGATLRVPNAVLDVGVALYDESGTLVGGRPPEDMAEDYLRLRTTTPATVRNHEESYRVLARIIHTRGGATVRAVLAERLAPYDQTERYALYLCIIAGLILVVAATAVAAWASHRVLQPVAEMARTAEDWSEHDLTRRFGLGGPGNEITALAATLDGLLDKVAHVIRTEQRLTAELAHELRTPLTIIHGNAELVAQRPNLDSDTREDLEEISMACRRMAATITGLLHLARAGRVRGDMDLPLADVLAEALDQLPAQARARLKVDEVPIHGRVSMPTTLAARALLPVLENASRFGATVQVHLETTSSHWLVHVDDDGAGLDDEVRAIAFLPGYTTGTGAGLGLPLARRIARSGGGDVVLGLPPDKWATRFTVSLPRGVRAPMV